MDEIRKEIRETFEKIMKRLDEIQAQVNAQKPFWGHPDYVPPVQPYQPQPMLTARVTCPKCGMVWQGVMGYVCADTYCPIQPKVICQTSYTTGSNGSM